MEPDITWLTNINYFETWRMIIEGSDLSEVHEFDGLMITDSGLPSAFFNVTFVQHPLQRPVDSIGRVLAHFKRRKLPGLICFPPGVDERTEALVTRRGYPRAEPHPGMTLYPIAQASEPSSGLEIRSVHSEEELGLFQKTAEEGFGMPYSIPQHLLSRRFLRHPNVSMFLGYANGEPACTSILAASGRIAGVYFVSTRPGFRQRGFGTAMTWHAVKTGQALGCDVATLQASAMGRPVYEKMGFRVTSDFRFYGINREG